MCMIFLLIQIKFNIDIKNDELLENMCKHKKKKEKKLIIIGSLQHLQSPSTSIRRSPTLYNHITIILLFLWAKNHSLIYILDIECQ
jgi:predicted ATP-dependent serine protease